MKNKPYITLVLIVLITFVYFMVIFFMDNEQGTMFGNHIQLLSATIATIWLFKAYRVNKHKEMRLFWLLLAFGCMSYSIAQVIWNFFDSKKTILNTVYISDYFWLIQYLFFILALLYITYKLKKMPVTIQFMFDIFIFLIASFTLLWDFLTEAIINPDIEWVIFTYPIYSLANIILFLGFVSVYLISYSLRKEILILSIGFFVKAIANISGFYIAKHFSISGYYGTYVDPVWALGLLVVGYAGIIKLKSKERKRDRKRESTSKRVESKNIRNLIIPYIGVSFLFLVLFLKVGQWNGITVGSILIILLLMVRQIMSLNENKKLFYNYEKLNRSLERKVKERTSEINDKNLKLERMAYTDALTDIPNRSKLKFDLDEILINKQETVTVLFINLDRFKIINDSLGTKNGDIALRIIASVIKKYLLKRNHVYRYGGDEFIILLKEMDNERVTNISKLLLKEVSRPFIVGDVEAQVTVSIGISNYPSDGTDSELLIKNADMAMHLAKERGRNNFQFFNSTLSDFKKRRRNLELGLNKAILNNEFHVNYQPQINLQTGEIEGVEVLLRWHDSELGQVHPNEFIPLAEETGLINNMGEWVLNKACIINGNWKSRGITPLRIAVNVSAKQLTHAFIEKVKGILERSGLEPQYLELEITESILQNVEESRDLLQELKKIGVKISLDDFGTGYSSLGLLNHLPIDYLKIDQSFVNDLIENSKTIAIIKTILDMGHNLGFKVIAEGIENETQYKLLKELGCDIGQGYYFSHPLSEKGFVEFLEKTKGNIKKKYL